MAPTSSDILVEAESFDDFGDWVIDSQFELEMGSPYLLAHGNGTPVADASTTVTFSTAGDYNVWLRTKDWVPGHHPGKFALVVNGSRLDTVFGEDDKDWHWQYGGTIKFDAGRAKIALHDLTGFGGRCDAVLFSTGDQSPPDTANEAERAWRRQLLGLPAEPEPVAAFDVVVVGGGVPGSAAALTAARLGERVALVHNRLLLGGNASPEAGLRPRGITGPLIDEIIQRHPNGELYAKQLLDAEANATIFLEYTVYAVATADSRIVSIDARDQRTGKEIRLQAPTFIDCSGRAILGLLSGAETLFGQESRAEYGESLAPAQRDNTHHGNTVFFRTRMADSPVSFPDVPWAVEVARDYSNLGGQLKRPGLDNDEGPVVDAVKNVRPRMNAPFTHYWEYGQSLDPYTQGEHIRDHLLRAIYGTFSNVKTKRPEEYANLELEWVAYVAATGEFRRYKGDHVLSEPEIRSHQLFPDAVVQNDSAFCLHYGGHEKYNFRLKDWKWDKRDENPYDIPFRCLYSCNVSNLMMAGKHISATHVASSNTKFMGNGGQHAIATAVAAHLCRKFRTTPRGIYETLLEELQGIVASVTGMKLPRRTSRL